MTNPSDAPSRLFDEPHDKVDGYVRNLIRVKAQRLVAKHGFTPSDLDDLQQELTLDVLESLPAFDADKAQLTTFISRVIDRKVSNIIRHRYAGKRDYRRELGSLDSQTEDRRCSSEKLDLHIDVKLLLPELSSEQRELATLLQDFSITATALRLGIPRTTLYSDIDRLRESLIDKGLGECA